MANITVTGTIKQIFNSEVYGNFEKRVFWVEENTDKYPNTYQLEMQQGECNRLDSFKAGDKVECNIEVKGRWYHKNGKEGVINTLKCWKLIKHGQEIKQPVQDMSKPVPKEEFDNALVTDDLPF